MSSPTKTPSPSASTSGSNKRKPTPDGEEVSKRYQESTSPRKEEDEESEEESEEESCDDQGEEKLQPTGPSTTSIPNDGKTPKVYLIVLSESNEDSRLYVFPKSEFIPEWKDVVINSEDKMEDLLKLINKKWKPYKKGKYIYHLNIELGEGDVLLSCSIFC
jgi:hypothetical protein